jgi:hypothetical protein
MYPMLEASSKQSTQTAGAQCGFADQLPTTEQDNHYTANVANILIQQGCKSQAAGGTIPPESLLADQVFAEVIQQPAKDRRGARVPMFSEDATPKHSFCHVARSSKLPICPFS